MTVPIASSQGVAAGRIGIWTWIVRGFAVIGVFSVAAIVMMPMWQRHQRAERLAGFRHQYPWPKVYRDCLLTGAPPLTDTQFLAEANAAWMARLQDGSNAYQQEYVGHLTDFVHSVVRRLPTPQTPKTQEAADLSPLDYETHKSAEDAARQGLKGYVVVSLATPGAVETKHIFRFDPCGTKF